MNVVLGPSDGAGPGVEMGRRRRGVNRESPQSVGKRSRLPSRVRRHTIPVSGAPVPTHEASAAPRAHLSIRPRGLPASSQGLWKGSAVRLCDLPKLNPVELVPAQELDSQVQETVDDVSQSAPQRLPARAAIEVQDAELRIDLARDKSCLVP